MRSSLSKHTVCLELEVKRARVKVFLVSYRTPMLTIERNETQNVLKRSEACLNSNEAFYYVHRHNRTLFGLPILNLALAFRPTMVL